jgi:hypothetical protein
VRHARDAGAASAYAEDGETIAELTKLYATVLQIGPYSFIFFSSDRGEPAHIQAKRDRQIAKFWLDPITLATNRGKEHELNKIKGFVEENREALVEAWNDFFNA